MCVINILTFCECASADAAAKRPMVASCAAERAAAASRESLKRRPSAAATGGLSWRRLQVTAHGQPLHGANQQRWSRRLRHKLKLVFSEKKTGGRNSKSHINYILCHVIVFVYNFIDKYFKHVGLRYWNKYILLVKSCVNVFLYLWFQFML
jgi:hypothetical protein